MSLHMTIVDADLSVTISWVGADPEPYNGDSTSILRTLRLRQGDPSGVILNELTTTLVDGPVLLGVMPGLGTYTVESVPTVAGFVTLPSTFDWEGGLSQYDRDFEYEPVYGPDNPAPADPANDLPASTPLTFRSIPIDTEIGLDDQDQRLRFASSVGAFYPNPDGECFFAEIADPDVDGIYDVDGSAYSVPSYLLRITANDHSQYGDDVIPLGGLLSVIAASPRPSLTAQMVGIYESVGLSVTRLGYGVMGRVGQTYTARRIGTADPEPVVDPPVVVTPPEPVVHLRHSSRHVMATVLNVVRDQLDELGWMDDTKLPFGAKYSTKVRFRDAPAFNGESLDAGIEPGVIAVTLGTEFGADEQEIGGGLSRQDYPIFFDVFQGSHPATTACANDIRDTLMGRFEGTGRVLPVVDQSTSTPVPGWTAELVDVEITRPEIRLPLHWQVVKVTAEVYFTEVQV